LLKNVIEAANARQKQVKKRSLCVINEHSEPVFNAAAATQIIFQRLSMKTHIPSHPALQPKGNYSALFDKAFDYSVISSGSEKS